MKSVRKMVHDDKVVVWGQWEDEDCQIALAIFPITENRKDKAEYLADMFMMNLEKIRPPYQIVNMEIDKVFSKTIKLKPIGQYRGTVGCVDVKVKEFGNYLTNVYQFDGIKACFIIENGYWRFKELVA